MQCQPNPGGLPPARSSVAQDEDALQSVVLQHLVCEHPAQLTREEIVRALADGSIPYADEVGVLDAIRVLTKAGLLREHGACVVPTAPARRCVYLVERG